MTTPRPVANPVESRRPAGMTHVRYRVLGMLFLVSIITYVDRVCIGSAAPAMQRDLGLTDIQLGLVFSAFSLAYGLFEIPSGWMGDRFGPRRMLTRIVVWWSVFTVLTGRAASFYALWITRFLFGAGEAGAYPNASCAIARWFPFAERARAQGIVWMASRLGGAIAPFLVVPLLRQLGWRNVFYIFGGMGVIWAAGWYGWYRDYPDQKRSVSDDEIHVIREGAPAPAKHEATPWSVLLGSFNLWAVVLSYFVYGYGVQFYFFWMPKYLIQARGIQDFAPYAALPFVLGAIANAGGGWTSDALVRRYGLKWGRRSIGIAGLAVSVACVVVAVVSEHPKLAVVALSMAFAATDFVLPNWWAVCLDIGKRYSGTVTGCMNTAAQLGGAIAATVIGYFAGRQQWNTAIATMGVGMLLSAVFYFAIDASHPLVETTDEHG